MTNHPSDPDPTGDQAAAPAAPVEPLLIPTPAAAYDRAFARAGVPVPTAVRLPNPLSQASDEALLELLNAVESREEALLRVLAALPGLRYREAERAFDERVLWAGVEATSVIRECVLTELTWRATRRQAEGEAQA